MRFLTAVSAMIAAAQGQAQAPDGALDRVGTATELQAPLTGSRLPQPPVVGDTATGQVESLDAREIRTRMAVPVTVNGLGPFRFVVDSGADRSVVGANLATRLGLPAGRQVTLHGVTGTSPVETVHVAKLTVGSGTIDRVNAPALPERYLGADGLLGVDALADQRVTLDFVAERMTIQGGGRLRAGTDEIVVTARRRFGQLILAEASVDADKIYAIVDTGAQVTLGNSALRAKVFGKRRVPPPAMPVDLVGVTGQVVRADLVVLPQIRIGGVLLLNVPVAFSDAPPFRLFGVEKAPAMLLGTDLLRSFRRVELDFRDKRVRFQLRSEGGIAIATR